MPRPLRQAAGATTTAAAASTTIPVFAASFRASFRDRTRSHHAAAQSHAGARNDARASPTRGLNSLNTRSASASRASKPPPGPAARFSKSARALALLCSDGARSVALRDVGASSHPAIVQGTHTTL